MTHVRCLGRTVFRMLTLLIGVSILSFALMEASPIDPLTAYIGTNSTLSEETKNEIAEHWGLNSPPVRRFGMWAKNFIRGDWGDSITFKRPVKTVILERFRHSVWLMFAAWILSGILGYVLGIAAAAGRDSLGDRIIKTLCLVFQSAPTFWIGLLVLSLFAVKLQWFPIGLAAPMGKLEEDITLADRIYHMALPALTLSVLGIGKITLYTRQKMIEVMESDYILFARARGESRARIVLRHGIRNTLMPAVTLQFASFSELFGGIALAESVFSYPGIGSALTAAGLNADVPLLLGIAVFSAIFVFVGNLAANLLYMVLDPRIREEAAK